MAVELAQKEMLLELKLIDSRAIDIVNQIPELQRNEVIEKYIILGDMVVSHALIGTRKEAVEAFFSPLKTDIETIREQLKKIIPTVATPAKKGDITVKQIFDSFRSHFMDDTFEDVSGIGKYADILATIGSAETPVLIELKEYSGNVPTAEVDKFWRDMERRGTKYGIFISMRSSITKCSSCINLKTRMDKTAIFVVNHELNWSGHLFAHYIVKKLIELETVKKKEVKGEEINKILTKVNSSILELKKNTVTINKIQNIADKLKTSCTNRLQDLITLANEYKRTTDNKISEIMTEIEKVAI